MADLCPNCDNSGTYCPLCWPSKLAGWESDAIAPVPVDDLADAAAFMESVAALRIHKSEVEIENDALKSEIAALKATIAKVRELLSDNGCECGCDHGFYGHSDGCTRCLACCVSIVLPREVNHV